MTIIDEHPDRDRWRAAEHHLTEKPMAFCRALHCGKPISRDLLMCGHHWHLVPMVIRSQVWRHYKRGQTIETATPQYCEAVAQAIEAVGRVEGVEDPANNPWRRHCERMKARAEAEAEAEA